MEAYLRSPAGDTLPRAVPMVLFGVGLLLEALAYERWQATPDDPRDQVDDAPSRQAVAVVTSISIPTDGVRVATRPRSCFPPFSVRFRPGETHFPDAQITRLTPLARWMSEHPGAIVSARLSLDDTAEIRASAIAWRLVALGVPRDRLTWRVEVDAPRLAEVRFTAAGFDDCPEAPGGGSP